MWLQFPSLLVAFVQLARASAPAGPWDAFNYAPSTKTVVPASIRSTQGTVRVTNSSTGGVGAITLASNGAWITLDFGKEVRPLIAWLDPLLTTFRLAD